MMRARFVLALFILGLPARTLAHDPGLSVLDVRVARTRIEAVLSISGADAEAAGLRDRDRGRAIAVHAIEMRLDGERLDAAVEDVRRDAEGAHIRLSYAGRPASGLSVRSTLLARLPTGHRQLLAIRREDGTLLAERLLDAHDDSYEVELTDAPPPAHGTAGFFRLGVEHILAGYDHLLFLAGLLLAVQTLRDALKIITAFTVAHAVTLGAAAFGAIAPPPSIVEPLIAASIVYVGFDNLIRPQAKQRWAIAFAFGLVHGFGLAGALRGIGQDAGAFEAAARLLAFNAGVETIQAAIAAAALPLLWRLRAFPEVRDRLAAAASAVILTAGSYWLIERSTGVL